MAKNGLKDRSNSNKLIQFKKNVLNSIDAQLTALINSPSASDYKRAALISYWLKDFKQYIDWEKTFDPKKLKRYERGDIIKVNLGFNIGNEEGGMHYAVVLDNNNALNSGVITIVPLSSAKDGQTIHPNDLYLGNEIYSKLDIKFNTSLKAARQRLTDLMNISTSLKLAEEAIESSEENDDYTEQMDSLQSARSSLISDINDLEKVIPILEKMTKEIRRMKSGSIALVSQITTVSKLRIYDPRNAAGALSDIKLSPEKLDMLNEKIKELFLR